MLPCRIDIEEIEGIQGPSHNTPDVANFPSQIIKKQTTALSNPFKLLVNVKWFSHMLVFFKSQLLNGKDPFHLQLSWIGVLKCIHENVRVCLVPEWQAGLC